MYGLRNSSTKMYVDFLQKGSSLFSTHIRWDRVFRRHTILLWGPPSPSVNVRTCVLSGVRPYVRRDFVRQIPIS